MKNVIRPFFKSLISDLRRNMRFPDGMELLEIPALQHHPVLLVYCRNILRRDLLFISLLSSQSVDRRHHFTNHLRTDLPFGCLRDVLGRCDSSHCLSH